MRTEYALKRFHGSTYYGLHGPYDDLAMAQCEKDQAERTGNAIRRATTTFEIVERDVTEWTPVPTHAPDWPEED